MAKSDNTNLHLNMDQETTQFPWLDYTVCLIRVLIRSLHSPLNICNSNLTSGKKKVIKNPRGLPKK